MKKKIKNLILVITILLWMVTACSKLEPLSTPTSTSAPIQKPEPGKATVTGKVISITTNKPLHESVWLAEVHRQGDQAVYLLDSAHSPSVFTDDNGIFVLSNVTPMEYVIIVGYMNGPNVVINDETGKPRVWNIPADKIFDTGELKVLLTK